MHTSNNIVNQQNQIYFDYTKAKNDKGSVSQGSNLFFSKFNIDAF